MLLCLVLSVAAGVAVIRFMVPQYEATASIRIDESGTATPVVDVLQAPVTGTTEIETEQAVLASRSLAEAALDSLRLQVELTAPRHVSRTEVLSDINVTSATASGLYSIKHDAQGRFHIEDLNTDTTLTAPILPAQPVQLPGVTFRLTTAALKYPELRIHIEPRSTVLARMLATTLVVVQPNRNANVLTATYTDPDSVLARDVPNIVAAQFIRTRQSAMQAQARNTVTFLHGQIDTLSGQLRSAEDALQAFREKEQLYEPETQGSTEVQYVANLEGTRNTLDAERSALANVMAGIHAEESRPHASNAQSPYQQLLGFPTIMATPSAGQLLAALATLENQRATLLIRRKDADPDVQTIDTRIHELESQIENLGATYAQSLAQREHAIDSTLTSYSAVLAAIPAKEIEFARLARQAKIYEDINTLLQTKLKEAQIAAAVDDPGVQMIDYAEIPALPVSPNVPLIAALSAILGILIGVIAAFIRNSMDRGVHTRDELALITGVPVLGLVPHIRSPRRTHIETRLISQKDPRNPVAEAYRTLRTNITFAQPDALASTIVLTSPMPRDGKSTSATNLAITLAQQGLNVLLVDADLRRGSLNTLFNVARDPGLSNVLIGAARLEDAVHRVDIGLPQGAGQFSVLSTGTLPPNPAELLASERCRTLIDSLATAFDVVLFDTPPMNLVTDAVVLASKTDAVIVVARAGSTTGEALAYSMEQLNNVRAKVIGTILNDMDFTRDAR
ncbi:MAG TPA: polysaccharide biosynthesis tyrosine autokinase, partial [Gemmatimonadaceae bacterium]